MGGSVGLWSNRPPSQIASKFALASLHPTTQRACWPERLHIQQVCAGLNAPAVFSILQIPGGRGLPPRDPSSSIIRHSSQSSDCAGKPKSISMIFHAKAYIK